MQFGLEIRKVGEKYQLIINAACPGLEGVMPTKGLLFYSVEEFAEGDKDAIPSCHRKLREECRRRGILHLASF